MFEKTIRWVVIYRDFKYTGWRMDSCPCCGSGRKAGVSAQRLQPFPPWAADRDVHAGGDSAATPCLTAAAGQPAAWTFPLSILGMVDVHVWGMGSWKQVLRWNLLKVLRWVRSSQCHIHLVAHRCGVASDWLKTSYYIMKRQCSVTSVGQRKDLWRYIKKQLWSWEASDERLLCKFLINPWPLSHLAELFIN